MINALILIAILLLIIECLATRGSSRLSFALGLLALGCCLFATFFFLSR